MSNVYKLTNYTVDDISKIPLLGNYKKEDVWIYAICRKECFLEKIEKDPSYLQNLEDILELHIFNKDEEYRYIKSKINEKNEFVLIQDSVGIEKFEDWMEFKETKIKVINYYDYEEGMIKFLNYRLSLKG